MGIYLLEPEYIKTRTGCYDTQSLSSFPGSKITLSNYITTPVYSQTEKLRYTQELVKIGYFILDLIDAYIDSNSIDVQSNQKVRQFVQAMKKANRLTESSLGKEFDSLWYSHILEILKLNGLALIHLPSNDFDLLKEVLPDLDETYRCGRFMTAPNEYNNIRFDEIITEAITALQLHVEDTLCDFFTGDAVFSNVNCKAHFVIDSSVFLAMNGFYRKGSISRHNIGLSKSERVCILR